MDVWYENSRKQKICLTQKPYVLLDGATVFDFSLDYTTSGKSSLKIKRFLNKGKKGNMTVIVFGLENVDALMDIVGYDIANLTPGRLYCGEQYCEGYIYGNKHGTKYNNSKRAELELSFVAENGKFIQEHCKSFHITDRESFDTNMDYPFDYEHDFSNSLVNQKIFNSSYASSNFELVVYGPCENPEVIIGNHVYGVNCSVLSGEYLIVNSTQKRVYKVKNNGEQLNMFHYRNRNSYLFEKIAPGAQQVSWSGRFGFDVKILSERSEPRWT